MLDPNPGECLLRTVTEHGRTFNEYTDDTLYVSCSVLVSSHNHKLQDLYISPSLINPQCACAARVTVLGLSVSQMSVCLQLFSHYRQRNSIRAIPTAPLQCNKRSKNKMAILLKRRPLRLRNWHYQGPRCLAQPNN